MRRAKKATAADDATRRAKVAAPGINARHQARRTRRPTTPFHLYHTRIGDVRRRFFIYELEPPPFYAFRSRDPPFVFRFLPPLLYDACVRASA